MLHGYICILPHIKLTWCSRTLLDLVQLAGVYISPGYTCIVPHVKLTWCSRALYVCILEYAKLTWCINTGIGQQGVNFSSEILHLCELVWQGFVPLGSFSQGSGENVIFPVTGKCTCIHVGYSVQLCSRDLWSFGGRLHLPQVYVHSAICATYSM